MKTNFSQKIQKHASCRQNIDVSSLNGIGKKIHKPIKPIIYLTHPLGRNPFITISNQHLRISSQNKELYFTGTFMWIFFLVCSEIIERTTIRRIRKCNLVVILIHIPSSSNMGRTISDRVIILTTIITSTSTSQTFPKMFLPTIMTKQA